MGAETQNVANILVIGIGKAFEGPSGKPTGIVDVSGIKTQATFEQMQELIPSLRKEDKNNQDGQSNTDQIKPQENTAFTALADSILMQMIGNMFNEMMGFVQNGLQGFEGSNEPKKEDNENETSDPLMFPNAEDDKENDQNKIEESKGFNILGQDKEKPEDGQSQDCEKTGCGQSNKENNKTPDTRNETQDPNITINIEIDK